MQGRVAFSRSVVCVVALSLVSACSTTRPVAVTDPQSLASQVAVGDTVEVERKDGSRLKFKVREVSPEGLRGADAFVPAGDIRQLRIVEGMHPAGVIFLVLLGAAAAWMIADPDDVCGDWPARPCE